MIEDQLLIHVKIMFLACWQTVSRQDWCKLTDCSLLIKCLVGRYDRDDGL